MSLNLIVIITLTILVIGCAGQNKEELRRLNDLQGSLVSNRENLNIDIETFNMRLTQMGKDLSYFKSEAGDTISVEFSNQLSKFNVIRKIYAKNTGAFAQAKQEQNELEEQLKNLKLDLEEGNISKEEFKEYFRKEKIDIDALILESKEIQQSFYQVEPDFRRIAPIVTQRISEDEAKLPQ